MVDQKTTDFFNRIYDETYNRALRYVISKCSNTSEVSDILQETYTAVFEVIVRKGEAYVKNAEGFVIKIAKAKIYKHYVFKDKIKNIIPMLKTNTENEEVNIIDSIEELNNANIEDNVITKEMLSEIWIHLQTKPQEVRKIFYLYYYLEMTIPQISKELNYSESYVKNKLYRTAHQIRAMFREDGD